MPFQVISCVNENVEWTMINIGMNTPYLPFNRPTNRLSLPVLHRYVYVSKYVAVNIRAYVVCLVIKTNVCVIDEEKRSKFYAIRQTNSMEQNAYAIKNASISEVPTGLFNKHWRPWSSLETGASMIDGRTDGPSGSDDSHADPPQAKNIRQQQTSSDNEFSQSGHCHQSIG